METVRVDIRYRPLRIGFAIQAGDMEAFCAAARISFALWGGRFNPIIVVDKPQQARSLIDVFRVDVIVPLGDSEQVKEYPKQFPHIITPFFPRKHIRRRRGPRRAIRSAGCAKRSGAFSA